MKKFYLIIFSCFLACQINAQFPAPYCAEIFPTNVEPITEIFFNSLINTTSEVVNGTPAHENFTSLSSGIFHRGETHFLSVQGNTNGNFSHYIRAFIDWNNDNDFLDVNESYDVGILTNSTGIDGLEVIANITIPYDITDGIKRMRITKKLNSYALPCNTTGSGQAEDYTINIVSSVAPYCENNFPDEVDPITRVTFAHLSNISNNVINSSPPHENFTDKKAFVQAGFTYPIEVSANTAGNYTNYVRLFVDWNNDYDFLDANESYDVGTITNSTGIDGIFVTANIAIPASATLGDHRMRVTQRYFSYAPPCNTVGYGQAEDYTIQVFSLSPYCTNDYTDTITPITRVTFSGIDIISNPIINVTPPHEDFTYVEGVVMPDSIYTIKVQGNTEGAFTDYIRVFIDWNNDYDFLDANESYDIGTITNSTGQDGIEVVGTITVPNGTVLGNKRMRITKKRSSYSASCETAGYGQMEDYTLKVVNNIKAIIAGGNTYLQGNYVEVGISQCGTFGTTGAAPQGYHARSGNTQIRVGDGPANLGFVADPSMDGWTVGSPYKYHGDYFMPASPYVGFAISHNGINNTNERAESSNATCGSFLNTTTTPFSGNNLSAFNNTTVSRGTWEGLNDGLKVQKITTVKQDKVYFTVKVKMYNTTALPISGVYYGDYVNPDNDAYENDILNPGNLLTTNSIIYQNPADGKSLVQAIGANGLQSYLGLGSKDCRSKVFKCVNPSPNYNTAIEMYNGTGPNPLDFTGTDASAANRFIGIAFNIGTIAAGDSTSFIYTYILKASDFEDALAETDPTFNFNGNETPTGGTITPCANTTNTIILNDADGYNWTWSPATGLNTTTGKQVNITVTTTPITYTVTGVSSGGCSNKIVTLNVEPVNITDIVLPSVVTKCETGAPLLLSATGGAFTNAIIYNESFNGEGNNWNKFNNTTGGIAANAAWTLRPNGYSYSVDVFNTNDNSQFYLSNSDAAGPANITATILQSPAISTINYASATVSFNHYLREPSTGSSTALVQASVDGVLWTTLQTYTSTQGSAASFAAVSIPLTAPFLNQSTVYIRFKYDGIYRWYWAINDIKITGSGQPIVWSPTTNLFTDAAGTIPYTGGIATSVFANPTSLTVYTAASTTGICSKSSNITVTLSPINTTIAGAVSATQCESKIVNALGSIYLNTACNPIAKVVPAGTNPVAGIINTCVYIDPLVLPTYNAEPYLPRHFDILPNTNAATSTGQITLYFNDAEFVQYNANNGLWPDLPTVANGGNSDANRSNLRVTQYHGTPNTSPSLPNQYSAGTGILINPNDADIFWNGNYWEVKFDVAGFSGFYIHTNLRYALPVEVNYLNGKKQGNTHVLDWKVTCNNTTGVKINLQRSGNNTLFNTIYTINATALQCAQPFYYVDIKPLSGINYYRLQLTDATGKTTYSNTITLINSITEIDVINIAPNPINKNGTFKLNIAATKANAVKISIFDLHGRLIKKQTIQVTAGLNYIDFNISNVSAGVYSLIVNSLKDEEIKTIRFVK